MVCLVSQTVCFVVARLADGKVTSYHVDDPSKARIKLLKIFQKMGFSFFFFLIMPRYWSEKNISHCPTPFSTTQKLEKKIKSHETCIVLVELFQFYFLVLFKCGETVHIFIVT